MNYLSLFSGIEAATVAWKQLGWHCVGVSEIDTFPCEVLKYHYPNTPNLGNVSDITKEQLNELKQKNGTIDIVVGGSPCQSFSIAGKRQGLNDPRGNLMFQYIRVVKTIRPKYFVWENVPGVLSSNNGNAFRCLLQEMDNIGYHLCWRVLDAKFFGVPQRRRRVFLVGCATNTLSATEILFELQSSKRNLGSSTEKTENNTPKTKGSSGTDCFKVSFCDEIVVTNGTGTVGPLLSSDQKGVSNTYVETNKCIIETIKSPVGTLDTNGPTKLDLQWAKSGQQVIETISIQGNLIGRITGGPHGVGASEEGSMYTLTKNDVHAVCFNTRVRRLTPIECERLQGFPDNYTQIPWRGKDADRCPDSHRYKALGNSMAVPVMKWIGLGIQMVEKNEH